MKGPAPRLQELPYIAESDRLFDAIADRPWAVFLDSGRPASSQGRYDILSCDPYITLQTRGEETRIRSHRGEISSQEDPFALLRAQLGPDLAGAVQDLPFCGGAIGYFGYDLAWRLERLPRRHKPDQGMPEMAVAIYDWALVVDHREQRSWLVGQGRDPTTFDHWQQWVERFSHIGDRKDNPRFRVVGDTDSNMSAQAYADAFQRVQRYIHEGDCYQVNLSQQFRVDTTGAPWLAYRKLRRLNPAPFSAYFNTPDGEVLSSSPERFLQVRGEQVETRPIKGTLPRGADPVEDRERISALSDSAKDRAENLMIVDLLRNDLSKSCALESIQVPELFQVESFATVHHLVSTVRGRLRDDRDAIDLLRGCFPGGSITGAPKIRAMEIIEELEPHRRGVYCGAIGYIGFDGNMDTSIAIRTLAHRAGEMRFCAGGGLVADSELEAEYQETYHKASAMLALLQQK